MRKSVLIISLVFLFFYGNAQERPAKAPPSRREMENMGVRLLNRFQVAAKKLGICPLFDTEGTLELFTEDAKIEVSSLKTKKIKEHPAEDYFRIVNWMKCGPDPVYKSMSFDYLPVSRRDGSLSCFNGNCSMVFELKQKFRAKSAKGKKEYCDITFKKVIVFFKWVDSLEGWEPKISGIYVEKTGNCEINDDSYAITNY